MKKTNLLIVIVISLFAVASFGRGVSYFWEYDEAIVNNDYDPTAPTTLLDSAPGIMKLRIKTPLNLRVAPVFKRTDVHPGLHLSDYVTRTLTPGTIVNVLENYEDYYKVAAPKRVGNSTKYEVGYIWKSDRYAETFVPTANEVNNPSVPDATPEGNFPGMTSGLEHPLCGCTHARCRVTSPYGMRTHPISRRRKMHWGIDFAGPKGTKVRAVADGIVSSSRCGGGYGICVIVNHRNSLSDNRGKTVSRAGFQSLYSHLSKKLVSPGQRVTKGQVIGLQGQTGYARGNNTHFEIRANGRRLNPATFFPRGRVDRGDRYPSCGAEWSGNGFRAVR